MFVQCSKLSIFAFCMYIKACICEYKTRGVCVCVHVRHVQNKAEQRASHPKPGNFCDRKLGSLAAFDGVVLRSWKALFCCHCHGAEAQSG